MPADGDWAAWVGFAAVSAGKRRGAVLVSIAATEFHAPGEGAAGEGLAAALRRGHPEGAVVEEFTTPGGHPAAVFRVAANVDVRGTAVHTGQVQALVAFSDAGALGVVSGVCFHIDDLDATAALVAEIAAGLSVERAAESPGPVAAKPGATAA